MIYFKNKHICSSTNLENNPPPLLALSPGPNKCIPTLLNLT